MPSLTPIFDIGSTFTTALTIGERSLPIHIKNMSRAELAEFKKGFDLLFNPRGMVAATDEEQAAAEKARAAYCDEWIRQCVTLDEGVLRFKDRWVTDGAGFIEVFHAREDVIASALIAIYNENHLSSVIRKNLNSPRDSGPGSLPSTSARGGDRPDSVAAPAAPSTSANPADAADNRASSADGPSSSGAIQPDGERSIH